jgi:hypothetical protein
MHQPAQVAEAETAHAALQAKLDGHASTTAAHIADLDAQLAKAKQDQEAAAALVQAQLAEHSKALQVTSSATHVRCYSSVWTAWCQATLQFYVGRSLQNTVDYLVIHRKQANLSLIIILLPHHTWDLILNLLYTSTFAKLYMLDASMQLLSSHALCRLQKQTMSLGDARCMPMFLHTVVLLQAAEHSHAACLALVHIDADAMAKRLQRDQNADMQAEQQAHASLQEQHGSLQEQHASLQEQHASLQKQHASLQVWHNCAVHLNSRNPFALYALMGNTPSYNCTAGWC